MPLEYWFILIGSILLLMGITVELMRGWPVTNAMVYLGLGFIIGPTVLNLFHFNPLKQSGVLEVIAELAVILSLFTAGLKMPVPVRFKQWRFPLLLGFLGMAITALAIAAFGYYLLGLSLGAAMLLGGILAPTDPVLAHDIQVRHTGDRDRLRFGLTCEAGINDGSAFPVVMLGLGLLGLHEIGSAGWQWALMDVLWATIAGVVLGVVCGYILAWIVHFLHQRSRKVHLLDNFLGLGLIAVVYGASLVIGAYGFLAVFAAAVALRHTEYRLTSRAGKETLTSARSTDIDSPKSLTPRLPAMTDRSLFFKEQLEHFSEIVLVLIIGGTLFLDSWTWRAVILAGFVFLVARPAGVLLATSAATATPWRERLLASWFGIRGIGSLYYLMFAIQAGLPEDLALDLIELTLIVVTLSILVHGLSVKPIMARFARK